VTLSRKHEQESWRLLDETEACPEFNLACEEAIARAAEKPTVRLWQNSRCVVLGRYQVREAEVDLESCAAAKIPVYRRFTGGGAVYHDSGNLNVSIVLPSGSPVLQSNRELARVPQAYSLVLHPLANALRCMGLRPQISARELSLGGRKISGAAAWLGRDAVLAHATLLLDSDLEILAGVLDGPGEPENDRWEKTRSRRVPVTSLVREGVVDATSALVRLTIVSAFAAWFGVVLQTGTMSAGEIVLANRLLAGKYSRPEWHASGDASRTAEHDAGATRPAVLAM